MFKDVYKIENGKEDIIVYDNDFTTTENLACAVIFNGGVTYEEWLHFIECGGFNSIVFRKIKSEIIKINGFYIWKNKDKNLIFKIKSE